MYWNDVDPITPANNKEHDTEYSIDGINKFKIASISDTGATPPHITIDEVKTALISVYDAAAKDYKDGSAAAKAHIASGGVITDKTFLDAINKSTGGLSKMQGLSASELSISKSLLLYFDNLSEVYIHLRENANDKTDILLPAAFVG